MGDFTVCPKFKTILYALAAMLIGAVLCAVLPGWLTVALFGALALAAACYILFNTV